MPSRLDLVDLPINPGQADVPCAVLLPVASAEPALPLCILLHGGLSSRELLVRMRDPITTWWEAKSLPPMVIATASTGPSGCYLDHPDGSASWETVVGTRLGLDLDSRYALTGDVGLLGLSMGGYGALKIAFAQPEAFKAVAAVEPMVEPALRASDVPPRNRFYASGPDLPAVLMGPDRDPILFERENPANRAVRNAERIQTSRLPIYLECGDDDALLFQDGTEFLHRVLWDLDLSHEYRLTAGADHVGSSLLPRLRSAFHWLGNRLAPPVEADPGETERAWSQWLAQGCMGLPPALPLDPGTRTMRALLRFQVAEARACATIVDSTTSRRFGHLPLTRIPPPSSGTEERKNPEVHPDFRHRSRVRF